MIKGKEGNIVWMDLEMTGLDSETDQIIEIATIITDADLNILAEGPNLVVHMPLKVLEGMDDWNRNHHRASGLWDLVLNSKNDLKHVETQTLGFLQQHVAMGTAPLAGNSIWQDRRFLARHMPSIDQYLHYRVIDVSTLKELYKRWYKSSPKFDKKKNIHRAKDDIHESILELKFYRKNMLS